MPVAELLPCYYLVGNWIVGNLARDGRLGIGRRGGGGSHEDRSLTLGGGRAGARREWGNCGLVGPGRARHARAVNLRSWGPGCGGWVLAWLATTAALAARDAVQWFVAPAAVGAGDGSSRAAAADFRRAPFWASLNRQLAEEPVTVVFLAGRYVVSDDPARQMPPFEIDQVGHPRHALVLEGERAGEVVFSRHEGDRKLADYPLPERRAGLKGPGLFFLRRGRNVTVRNLTFTAPDVPMGYTTNFAGGRDVTIEHCHWHDLQGVYFGASGTVGAETDHVTFRHCRFERVGSGGHAHMIYNAYDPLHVRVIDCHFEDCAGDYVRFRDGTDYGVVYGCTFRSTGRYLRTHQTFVAVPLFNDDDPARPTAKPNYEYFGTRFLIAHNRFIYENEESPATRCALVFHHSGFDPPGRQHLLDRAAAQVLRSGTPAERRALLQRNLGLDVAQVHVFGNEYVRVAHLGLYRGNAAYGARARGGEGQFDIADLFNPAPVVRDAQEAMAYFGRRTERVP